MSITIVNWLLAFSPLIILIFLMTVLKQGSSKAGIITWIITQIIAFFFFGTGINILGIAFLKSLSLAAFVLLVIWGAMYLYQVTKAGGTIQKIGTFLSGFTNNKAYLGIFLGWLFPSFLQGMGGFGVPVAVSAPLLVSAGFSPISAMVLTSIGHGWGVSFGSMGTSILTMEAVTGLSADFFTTTSAILLGIAEVISGLFVVFLAGGKKHFLRALPLAIICAAILGVGQFFIAGTDFWVLSVTLPAIFSLIFALTFVGTFSKHSRNWLKQLDRNDWKNILTSIVPYILLVALILIFNFVKPIQDFFSPFNIVFNYPALETEFGFRIPEEASKSINLFLHPGTILMITGIISYIFLKKIGFINNFPHKKVVTNTISSVVKSSIAIISLVGAATTMRHAGMIALLAKGISALFPRNFYPVISPLIGALGAFITGSNSNSNVLFSELQLQTAEILALPVAWILAGQTTGAAIGSIMAPAKVVLGCQTVGLQDQEGQVISKLILICMIIVLIIGGFTYLFSRGSFSLLPL